MKHPFFHKKENTQNKIYPLKMQLFGITAALICVGGFAILLLNSQLLSGLYVARQRSNLREVSKKIEKIVAESNDFYNDMSFVEEDNNIDVEIYNSGGRLVYDSAISSFMQDWVEGSGVDFLDGMRSRKMIVKSHKDDGNNGYLELQMDTRHGFEYLVYGKTLDSGSELKVYSQLNYLENSANTTTRYVSFIACATFMLIILSLYFCVRHLTNPLVEMNSITRGMAKMDFSQKCPPYSNNEIGELGRSINTLSSSLDETLRDLQKKNKKLEDDIEHERKLEQMRKEFISNASHELKTPIAIIQGYAEGLKLGIKSPATDNEDYCDIIIEETHKMNNLVCELLELSKYESGAYALNPRDFDVGQFIKHSIGTYDILAREKGIDMQTIVPDGLFGYGDPDKLDMVIHNYVSNALSHASGEKKITISAAEYENCIRVSVFNTGDKIEDNELDSIWLSFYRADKAHSRAEGRFGLGLSIVKAIQELHNMPYGVENVPGGVVFTFDIAKGKEPVMSDDEE